VQPNWIAKYSIFAVLLIISISAVTASVYTYNSTGFFVNETFDSYNSTMWYNTSLFTITGGKLHWTGVGGGLTYHEFILNDTNFLPNMTDEWDYEAKVSIPTCSDGVWGSPTLNLFNVTSFSYPAGGFQLIRPFIANGVAGCADMEYIVLISENNRGNASSSNTITSLKKLNATTKNMSLYKRNLANGSWYMTAYFDGAMLFNLTNSANLSNGVTQNLSNFNGKGRFAIVGYGQSTYAFDIDELVIRNYYYTFPTTEPNTAPTVTINSPANDTTSSTRQNISFTATDPEQANTSCNLYIDSTLNLTNSTVLNNTATLFSPTWSVGSHSYYITCSDGINTTTSQTRTFTYDRSLAVTASAPADHTVSSSQVNVTFTAVDNKIIPMSCDLNIDDSVYATNGAVANNTLTTFPVTWTIGTHLWNVTCSDGEITGASAMRTFTFNSSHSLVLWNPPNATRTNVNENVAFEVYDSDNATTSCSLYIDSVLNATDNAVVNDTVTYFFPAWSQGVHNWYVQCNDGLVNATSQTRVFDYDTSSPFIQSVSPSTFNTTIFSGYSMNIEGNVTDNNLWRVNRTISYPNGSVFYTNYSGDLAPLTTEYSWDDAFNTTMMPNGVYTLFIDVADSHTANLMEVAETIEKDISEKKLSYELTHDTVEVAMVGGSAEAEFADVTTTKLQDRYTFDYSFKKEIAKGSTSIFRVTSTEPIIYLRDSQYTAHFILAEKYWLDFEEVKGNKVEVKKVDDYNYDVTVTFEEALSVLKFQSLGGLNEANLTIQFEIDNCVPSWSCGGYGSCLTNDTALCTGAIDLNLCGIAYGGDLSEFTSQSCNYCSYDVVQLNESACVSGSKTVCSIDNNYATCCNVTVLTSDCYGTVFPPTSDVVCGAATCSMFGYGAEDITGAVIDGAAKLVIGLASVAFLVGMIYVGLFAYNRFKMR
jgi:hypothetical protein